MTKPQNRAENKVLLLCAHFPPEENKARLKELLGARLDWDYLYKLAQRHSVLPLLYQRLQRMDGELVPVDWLKRLKQSYQENAARNVILTHELVSIIQELEAIGIEAIPFKGPALAMTAYSDLALRRFIDLDLIVRRRDVMAARDFLIARGYQTARNLDPRQQPLLLSSQHNIQFTRDEGRLIVELHWRVAAESFAASVSAEQLWRNLNPINLNHISVKTLSPEDLLFCLCVHGSRHLWERLSWICDVAALIDTCQTIDWPLLLKRVEETDTERMFFLGVSLANSLCGASLPAEIVRRIAADGTLVDMTTRISDRLFSGTEHVPATSHEIFRYNFSVRKSWSARIRYILFALGPSDGDLEIVSLPRVMNVFYYGLRPLRLLSRPHAAKPVPKTQQKRKHPLSQ